MIFDRTSNDILNALSLIRNKVQKFENLTENEKKILERGTLTINTINRIESKQNELLDLLNEMGYWNNYISSKTWTHNDLFYSGELKRIIDNGEKLKKSFFVYGNTPLSPSDNYHYNTINAIEKILYDLETMIDYCKANYKECGNFECGE